MLKDRSPGGLIITGLQVTGICFVLSLITAFYSLGKGEADRNFDTTIVGYLIHGFFVVCWVLMFVGLALVALGIVLAVIKRLRSR